MTKIPTPDDFIPNFRYQSSYAAVVRGEQERRPWALDTEILQFARKDGVLLDVGCGTARKLVSLAPSFARVLAVEPGAAMRLDAERVLSSHLIDNSVLLAGDWHNLPVATQSVDVVTSMLAGFFVAAICRVLKPGGTFILETIGPRDQVSLKSSFGSDELGPRGQYLQFGEAEFMTFLQDSLKPSFERVQLCNGFWHTYYRPDDVLSLLASTPLVRNFDPTRDAAALAATIKMNQTSRGTRTTQNRVLAICTGRL